MLITLMTKYKRGLLQNDSYRFELSVNSVTVCFFIGKNDYCAEGKSIIE